MYYSLLKEISSKKFLTHAVQGGMSRGEQTIYAKILTKYNQMLTKYDSQEQIHVENFQERHFPEIKRSNAKNHAGLGWGGIGIQEGVGWAIGGRMSIFRCSRPLLIANAPTNTPYSWQLLIGPMELLFMNYCKQHSRATAGPMPTTRNVDHILNESLQAGGCRR